MHREELDAAGLEIVVGSVDREPEARRLVRDLGLGLTVLYGLDCGTTAAAIGCYTGARRGVSHLQPTAFILHADGRVRYAVYSSGKAGRLAAADALEVLPGPSTPNNEP